MKDLPEGLQILVGISTILFFTGIWLVITAGIGLLAFITRAVWTSTELPPVEFNDLFIIGLNIEAIAVFIWKVFKR